MALPASLEGKLRIPLIGAPMYIVSNPALVIEQCKAGIIGAFFAPILKPV
jgi:nitronate monooxygenase